MARLEVLRIYDAAIHTFAVRELGQMILQFKTGDPNEWDHDVSDAIHMATADRPYGFEIPLDPNTGDVDTKRAERMLVKPQIAITRGDPVIAMDRMNTNQVRAIRYWDQNADFVVRSDYPRPWDIPYWIDIYARQRRDAQKILNYFLYAPDPTLVMYVDFDYPWGRKGVSMIYSGINEMTEYEPGEGLRLYHYRVPVKMEAWMFGAFENPGDIRHGGLYPNDRTSRVRTVKSLRVRFIDAWSCKVMDEIVFPMSETPPNLVADDPNAICPNGVIP